MQNEIFTVYDEKAQAHLPPWFMHNQAMAIRTFKDCINAPEHQFSHHPEDYTLFFHGSFENDNASFTITASPKPLGNGIEYVDPNKSDKDYALKPDDAQLLTGTQG